MIKTMKIFIGCFLNIFITVYADSPSPELKRTVNWYFGHSSFPPGFNFATTDSLGLPIVTLNGKLGSSEGIVSMSDINGKFLFVSNGQKILNANMDTMVNGIGLDGSESSQEGIIAIPFPCSDSLYYLFYADDLGASSSDTMKYAVINMSLDNGLGAVTQKNITLPGSGKVYEHLAAVHHANGLDVWLAYVDWTTAKLYAHLIKKDTILPPIISNISASGYTMTKNNSLHFSPNGQWIALGRLFTGSEFISTLASFNNQTGQATPFLDFSEGRLPPVNNFIGVSFSANSSKLYFCYLPLVGIDKVIAQYNLSLTSPSLIDASMAIIGIDQSADMRSMNRMQLGPDGRIYVTESVMGMPNNQYMGYIDNADQPAPSVVFYADEIYLEGRSHSFGLPQFIDSYFDNTESYNFITSQPVYADFIYQDTCYGSTTLFTALEENNPDLFFSWNLGTQVIDTIPNIGIAFDSTGYYTMTLIATNTCNSDTATKQISIIDNCSSIFIPNVFTPNGDNKNDLFIIQAEGIDYILVQIYDRFGRLIFQSDELNQSWDGSINGKPLNKGTYIYTINGTFKNKQVIEARGNLTLIR